MTASSASRTTRPRSPPFPFTAAGVAISTGAGESSALNMLSLSEGTTGSGTATSLPEGETSRIPPSGSAGTLRASVSGSMAVCSASGRFQAKQVLPRYQPPPAAGARRDACSPGSGGNISFPPCGRTLPSSGESETVIPLSPAAASRSAWRGASPLRMISQESSDPSTQLPSASSRRAPR